MLAKKSWLVVNVIGEIKPQVSKLSCNAQVVRIKSSYNIKLDSLVDPLSII